MTLHKSKRFIADTWKDHELVDSGNGAKLERFGSYVLDRPEPGAVWPTALNFKDWDKADASFEPTGKKKGVWLNKSGMPENWHLEYNSEKHYHLRLKFQLEMTRFKHVGVFPEQASNWEYIAGKIKDGDKLLNLFAYTGGASLAAKAAGADVTHVDAIRQVIDWR